MATPPPLLLDRSYTPEVLVDRIDYASQRLNSTTRFLTPNSRKLLTIYHDACASLHLHYDGAAEQQKTETIKAIRGFEVQISTAFFLRDVSSDQLLQELITLRQMTFWARYGDYAGHIASKLRQGSAMAQPPSQYANKISGEFPWTKISEALKDEEQEWKMYGSKYPDRVPTTFAVYSNSQTAGIQDYKNMISIIHLYADRNQAFHRGLQQYLEEPDYGRIARCLWEDLRDLSSVCPPSMAGIELTWRSVLEQMRDEWFDISPGPENPSNWNNKPAIRIVHDRLQKNKAEHQRNLQLIAAKAASRLAMDQEPEALFIQACTQPPTPFQLPDPGPGAPMSSYKGKGKVKAQKPIDVSDRRKAWDTIMKQQLGQLPQLEMTLSKQREINRIVSAYRAVYGDDAPPPSPPTV
ncbi:MAG: hypothetical protein Q9185_001246 [Variospora sp. 1 TL-2023]